ncbi:MAG: hypothetical protein A4E44_00361 [Methanosaeta sp. PtaB.Bin018]|nr:MAG: hypothetical protein A4E44_00361 [Methanosaeta sp. PtaB.Bin018]
MKIACKVTVCEVRRQKQQVLLLADLVRFLLVAGLGVLLQVSILLGLEASADIDEVSIVDRRSNSRADVPPLSVLPLQEDHVHDLSYQRTTEVPDIHPPYPALHLFGDILCFIFCDARLFIKLF